MFSPPISLTLAFPHLNWDSGNVTLANLTSSYKPTKLDTTSDPALGSRKRNIRDEIKDAPVLYKMTKGRPKQADGSTLREWKVKSGTTATPWLQIDHSDTVHMGLW